MSSSHLRVPRETSPASWLVTRRELDQLERFLPLVRGRFLDLGCGRMPHFGALRPLVEHFAALDHPAASDLAHAAPPGDAQLVWGDAEALPFRGGQFDTVILLEVLEHLPHPWRLWEELARVISPGGHAFVTCPFHYPVHMEPHDYFRYTAHGLRRLAEEAGFDVLWMEPKGGIPTFLVDVKSKILLWISRALHLPAGWIGWLQRLAYRLPGMRRERAGASRYTLGQCMAVRRR
jgi:SAM-dependent methyltransferase